MLTLVIIHILWSAGALVLLSRRQALPASAAVWSALIALLPVVGTLLYVLFAPQRNPPSSGEVPLSGDALADIITRGCGTRQTLHNRVVLLHNGNNAFSALIAALQRARFSIHVEYYIFRDDRIGRAIADILSRKARAGVDVRIIYDALGSWRLGGALVRDMRRSGVRTAAWEPLRFPWVTHRVSRRNHRKIVIVDGRVAFVGGVNIAKYYLDGDDLGRWRDEHLSVEGDAVGDLQRLFLADWRYATGEVPSPDRYIVHHEVRRRSPLQLAWSQPGTSRLTLLEAFSLAISRAKSRVRISTPYFIPPSMLFDSLRLAARSGVRVEILVPERSDSRLADIIMESYMGELLDMGVEVSRYDRGFLHSKLLIVDDVLASVGTANMDYRSLTDNLEVTAFIRDRGLVRELAAIFDSDRSVSGRVVRSNLGGSAWRQTVRAVARYLAPFM